MSNMRYASPKKSGKGGKGFFVALGVCLIAVGAAAFLTYQNVSQYFSPEQSTSSQQAESAVESTQQAGNTVSGVKEPASSASSSEAASSAAESGSEQSQPEVSDIPQDDGAAQTAAQTSDMDSIVLPVDGSVIKEFSGESPVYSVTFNDWRVHEGADFAADKGAVVKAFTGGQVKEIYDDPMLGKTIIMSLNGGYEAYYCGLGETTLVNVGDSVYPGQDIGSVKEVPSEILDASHLHLGLKKDGVWINPMDVLSDAKE